MKKDFQDSELQYKSHKLEPLPKEVELRPFHIMRRIENSWSDTMDNEGGYITENLFIPKYIWYQKKTQIPDIEKKVEYFIGIQKEFKKVNIIYKKNGFSKDWIDLETLANTLSRYHQMLYDDFPFLNPYNDESKRQESAWSKIGKSFDFILSKITKGAYGTSSREYAKWLKDLFSETYFIEELVSKGCDDKIRYICQFLWEVVLSIALHDIKYLVTNYLKVMKQEALLKKHNKEKLNVYKS